MDTAIVIMFNGKQYELRKFGPADLVAFERHFGVSATAFSDGDVVRFEWMCFLVWRGLRRLEVITKEQAFDDDFLEGIEDLQVLEDEESEESANPTEASVLVV